MEYINAKDFMQILAERSNMRSQLEKADAEMTSLQFKTFKKMSLIREEKLLKGLHSLIGKIIKDKFEVGDVYEKRLYAHKSQQGISISFTCYYDKSFNDFVIKLKKGDFVEVEAEIKEIEKYTSHSIDVQLIKIAVKRKSGCFIATACYGDYNCNEVNILKEFRDEKLKKTLIGKQFIRFYYWISPNLADFIIKSPILKRVTIRYILDPIVTLLIRLNR